MFVLADAAEDATRAKARETFTRAAAEEKAKKAGLAPGTEAYARAVAREQFKPVAKAAEDEGTMSSFLDEVASMIPGLKPGATAKKAVAGRPVAKKGRVSPKLANMLFLGLGAFALTMVVRGAMRDGSWTRNPRKKKGRRRPRTTSRRRPATVVRNPSSADPDVQRAIDFRREFHWGYPAKRVTSEKVYPRPRVMTELGRLVAVRYRTNKKGERAKVFHHDFEGRLPRLGMDIKNKRLHIYDGTYTVTADGITG